MNRTQFLSSLAGGALATVSANPARAQDAPTLRVYGPGGPAPAMKSAALDFRARTGIAVDVVAGPTPMWKARALADADVIFSGSENMMTDFVTELPGLIAEKTIEPAYVRPASILVHPGNPKGIHGLRDLMRPGIRVMVVQGAGQTGLWEDLVGRGPHPLADLRALRRNIVVYAANSALALAAWTAAAPPDAWIIYAIWQIAHPDVADVVPLEPEFALSRDMDLALTVRGVSNPAAHRFYDYILSAEGARVFARWGWSS
jgi:accessory colonization factor AcfC